MSATTCGHDHQHFHDEGGCNVCNCLTEISAYAAGMPEVPWDEPVYGGECAGRAVSRLKDMLGIWHERDRLTALREMGL
jgi:hypothetical protein